MILRRIIEEKRKGHKSVAMLIDPDKIDETRLLELCGVLKKSNISFILVGGSLITSDNLDFTVKTLKEKTGLPIILFPGNSLHICHHADAILLLCLISGRNPEYLIGQHVLAAPFLINSPLEIISTAYMLVDGGKPTTVSYISNTTPLPSDKPDIAAATAMAGELIGMKINYLDAGSGASNCIHSSIIKKVRKHTINPLIVGGGIDSIQKIENAFESGADIIVIGNAFERNPDFFFEVNQYISERNLSHA